MGAHDDEDVMLNLRYTKLSYLRIYSLSSGVSSGTRVDMLPSNGGALTRCCGFVGRSRPSSASRWGRRDTHEHQ